VYVTEVRSGRVTRVRLSDGARRTVAKGLKAPEGIARHPDGGLIVAEVGRKRLVRIEPATGRSTVLASGLRIGLPESEGLPPGYGTDVVGEMELQAYALGNLGIRTAVLILLSRGT
jgi:sugar lactone lactonase YvrE